MAASATTSPESAAAPRPAPALIRAWVGVLLAPASWVADLLSRYMLIRYSNIHDVHWPLRISTLFCLALVLLGGWLCQRVRREAEPGALVATLALWGLGLAAFFLLLILAQAYPAFVLSAREIT
jgi:hypothetical protein